MPSTRLSSSSTSRRPTSALLAALLLLGVVLAACGGDDSTEATDGTTGTGPDDDAGVGFPLPPADDDEPVPGGRLVYALAAETDGWDPTGSPWAPSGLTVARSVFDTLTVFDDEGTIHPYLAESFEPNETYDSWVITLRPGVRFHNGEELTAQVLQDNWELYAASPLVRRIFEQVESTEVIDELSLRVETTNPWVNFPNAWTTQVGVVMAPESLAASPEERARNPIGTGPFRFVSWEPDRNLVVERNDDYWQEGFPYLNEIEFRVITDPTSRSAALRSGDIDLTRLEEVNELMPFADDPSVTIWSDPRSETAESFVMLNTMQPPLDDLRVRQALAHATDRATVNQVIAAGQREVASGPYRPSSPWYAETDYPDFDPAEARRLLDEYEAEHGPVRFTLEIGSAGAENQQLAQLLQEQWQQAGVDVAIGSSEVSTLILAVVLGNYDAVVWRQFDSPHPLQESVWWSGDTAEELGEFGLNFARNRNQAITDALEDARAAESVEEERERYAEVQRQLAADVPYVWLTHIQPTMVAADRVVNVLHATVPDQPDVSMMSVHNSAHTLHQVWIRDD